MVPTILQACDDSELFGFELYPRQRELLAALEAGPRIAVWALGRRSGKTTLGALASLHACLFRPDLDALVRRGERRYAVGVATNQSQARLLVQAARSIVERSPLLAALICSDNEDSIGFELPSGARTELRAFPCNSRGGRGWPISFLVMDEAAHFLSENDGWQAADRVFGALIPATAQFGTAARIVVSSTPFGTEGFFATLYQQAASGELADAAAHHAATVDVNPTITGDFLASEQVRDPDSFRSEYEAEFLGSGGAYLDWDHVEIADYSELPPDALHSPVAGLDAAFSSDPFGVAIVAESTADAGRLAVGCVRAFRSRRADSFEERDAARDEVLDQVIDVCHRYRVTRAVVDQYAATPIIDRLYRAGLAVTQHTMTAATKTAIFGEMRARLYQRTLALPDDPELLAEARRLRTKHTAGQSTVVNPRVRGSHGDRVQALALAVYELRYANEASGRLPGGGAGLTLLGDLMGRAL